MNRAMLGCFLFPKNPPRVERANVVQKTTKLLKNYFKDIVSKLLYHQFNATHQCRNGLGLLPLGPHAYRKIRLKDQ